MNMGNMTKQYWSNVTPIFGAIGTFLKARLGILVISGRSLGLVAPSKTVVF